MRWLVAPMCNRLARGRGVEKTAKEAWRLGGMALQLPPPNLPQGLRMGAVLSWSARASGLAAG
jgi:hypothetical protein